MRLIVCLSVALRVSVAQTITNAPSTPPNLSSASGMPFSISGSPDGTPNPITSPTISFFPTDKPTTTLTHPPSLSTRPSAAPSSSTLPTISSYPSFLPSPSPTYSPTLSSVPTLSSLPSQEPSYPPSSLPSIHPTLSAAQITTARYEQRLLVTTSEILTPNNVNFFQFLYERYTASFGYNVTKPQIVSTCVISQQTISQDPVNVTMFNSLGLFKRRKMQEFAHVLSVTFTMEYRSQSMKYDISDYNILFKNYVNLNTTKVAMDMALIGLPVVGAGGVIMFTAPVSTFPPTGSPTVSPIPTFIPSSSPSELPSDAPSKDAPAVDVVSKSFALGISLGIAGACVIVLLGYMYRMHLENSEDETLHAKNPAKIPDDDEKEEEEGIEMGIQITGLPNGSEHHDGETRQTESTALTTAYGTLDAGSDVRFDGSDHRSTMDSSLPNRQYLLSENLSTPSIDHFLSQGMSMLDSQRASEMFPDGNNTGMVHSASFSSSNGSYEDGLQHADSYNESFHASAFDGSTDELDNYKNQNIEVLRKAVEQAVDDVEDQMMLAVTNALTQPPPFSATDQDHSELEAESLYQTYDWWKRNENSPIDSKREYFQELLNRIVNLVFYGLIPPLQGSQIVHGCATIIGLPLLHTLPETTIIIQGMLKTNNLSLGLKCINTAFKPFGDIESAAIAPNNHGFGFVRFVQAKSAARVMSEYRDNEIVIQDVAVSVKVLKSEGLQ